jgi:hypothetical protein
MIVDTMPAAVRAPWSRSWLAALAVAALFLSGCATSTATGVAIAASRATASAPRAVAVKVAVSPELRSDPSAGEAADLLQYALLKHYEKAGRTIAPDGAPAPALVHVRIVRADGGNQMQRMLVGFSSGRSSPQTDTTFQLSGQDTPALSFSSSTKSSRKPGLILPGAVAAATGEASRLAIGGGINLLVPGRAGLRNEAERSAKQIVKQTRQLYLASGWQWPSDSEEAA